MKKISFLFALLCASVMSFAAIDWSQYEYLGDGAGGGAYSNKYKVAPAEGQNVVNIQKPGWAAEAGIYTSDFGGAIQSCSLGDKCAIDGGGVVLYLSAFTAKETEVTIVAALGTKTFTVYYEDGTEGGGSGEPSKIYDVNFALASNGSSATASSGNAALAIDGNQGTRWESATTKPNPDQEAEEKTIPMTDEEKNNQWWKVDMGQLRIYNTIQIRWEGAYGKTFDIESSKDGESWKTVKQVVDQSLSGFPYEQVLELAENDTAQYIRFTGIARGTQYGYSFWEFRVLLPNVSVLTSINLTAANTIAQVGGAGVALTAIAKDQNNTTMEAEISYEIIPADAGNVVNGKYIPAKLGNASIVAYNGEVRSEAVTVFGYEGNNLALSTNISTDNKIIAQVAENPDGSSNDAFFAVDGNEGSVWQGSLTDGSAGDETSRTYDAWFVVDLGGKYTIDLVTIKFEGACSQDYHIDFSEDNTVWNLGYNYVGTAGINGRTDVLSAAMLDNNQKVRYVRFWSTKAGTQWGVKVFEFQVFGREYVPAGDTEKPEMTSAELVSKTWNSAVIAVAATDNNEVAKYHVVNTDPAIDVKLAATDGKITVTGLTAETAYNFTITAIDAAQNESENSKSVEVTTNVRVIVPTTAAPVPEWPAAQVKSLYSDAYVFAPASLVSYNEGWWDNPNMTQEAIGEDHYLHYDLYRNGIIGAQFAEISVLNMEKVHIDIFASAAGSVTFRPITVDGPSTPKTLNLQAEQWNSFDIDMSDFTGHDWSKLFQFAIEGYNAGGLVGEHISVDNVYFYRTTEQQDEEAPTSVTAEMASASYFSVVLAVSAEDNSGAVSYVVKNGEIVVANGAGASGATVNITVNGLTPNTEYAFKVIAKDEKENEAAPVNVPAQTLAAPAAAPVPTAVASNVKALFADDYELATTGLVYRQDWWYGGALEQGKLSETDNVLFYTKSSEVGGAHGWAFTPFDATGFTKLHISIYPLAAGTFNIYPVITDVATDPYVRTSETLVANQWNEVVFDFSELVLNPVKQLGWNTYYSLEAFFVDNVYFFKEGATTAIDNANANANAVKRIENGQLIIIKNGIRYNVAGQKVQ